MYLDSAKKEEIFAKYGKGATDTGSPEAQIALFSFRIAHLTDHLRANHKDFATSRSMKMLVGKRRRMLDYLAKKDINRYRAKISGLGLRLQKERSLCTAAGQVSPGACASPCDFGRFAFLSHSFPYFP